MRLASCLTALATLSAAFPVATAADVALRFELGAGIGTSPAYEGSDEYTVGPKVGGSISRLNYWFLNIDRGDGLGFGIGPSIRVLAERDDADYARLTGIDDVDAAFELGVRMSYRWEQAEIFGALRGGVTGHEGMVMDLGADGFLALGPQTELRVGPRLRFADDTYADTYFDVPTGARLAAYDADGGLYSAGLEMSLRHDFNESWGIEGTVGWSRLTGSIGDSPVVQTRDQGRVGVLLIRSFDWAW